METEIDTADAIGGKISYPPVLLIHLVAGQLWLVNLGSMQSVLHAVIIYLNNILQYIHIKEKRCLAICHVSGIGCMQLDTYIQPGIMNTLLS